jgi:hypothetical protein
MSDSKSTERNHLLSGEEELQMCLSKFSEVFNVCTNGSMPKFLAEYKAYVASYVTYILMFKFDSSIFEGKKRLDNVKYREITLFFPCSLSRLITPPYK